MSESKPQLYLKDRVRLRTKPFLVVGALLLLWVNLGLPTSLGGVTGIDLPASIMKTLPSLLSLVVMAIDALPGQHIKAVLVFWLLRHPLPGSRAFEKVRLDSDSRIDKRRLRSIVGGNLPRAPAEQNRTWYRLYRSVESDPRILGLHAEYLVLRDLTWFSVVLTAATLLSLALVPRHWLGVVGLAAVFGLFYLLFRRAAYERGDRFVTTVLAVLSTEREK